MMERIASALHWPVSDQLQAWGYALDSAENRANPFDRDDPRWHYVETLKRFDLSRPEHGGLLAAIEVRYKRGYSGDGLNQWRYRRLP